MPEEDIFNDNTFLCKSLIIKTLYLFQSFLFRKQKKIKTKLTIFTKNNKKDRHLKAL